MTSLYIHIPFCKTKCPYCSFASVAGRGDEWDGYIEAVRRELLVISETSGKVRLSSIFIGGGTPTVLGSARLVDVLATCRTLFSWQEKAEISIEANPGTIDLDSLVQLHDAGVNRISLGVQSLVDVELQILGRCHDSAAGVLAVKWARTAGFTNINLDLMYGLPGQNVTSWSRTLNEALACEPNHLSCYQLTIEEGTSFARQVASGALRLPDESEIEEMDAKTLWSCKRAGLQQYEISNYALSGQECRHNINYWQNGEYLAAGAGAVSFTAGRRARREEDPRQYCRLIESCGSAVTASECLDLESSFREAVVMGLRMNRGVSCLALQQRYGYTPAEYYGDVLKRLLQFSLLESTPTHLRLSPRGRQVANTVMAELV